MEVTTIRPAIAVLISSKQRSNRRSNYVAELTRSLSRFADFTGDIALRDLQTHTIEEWLDAHSKSPWTRRTYISRLSTLFEFCRRRRWITENPCDFLDQVTIDQSTPSILTPQDANRLIDACRDHYPRGLAWLSLCLFAGLRPEEAMLLDWNAIDLERRRIWLTAAKSKGRRSRIVEPPSRCFELLSQAKAPDALPLPHVTKRRIQRRLRKHMGWDEWPKDILRHSCASYWLALTGDPQAISVQLGNSPSVLFRHYRAVVSRDDAEQFFNIQKNPNKNEPV